MDEHGLLSRLWAKSAPEGQDGETLLEHSEAVVRALAGIASLRPALHLEAGAPRLWHWAFWACCLHDLGKAASGFQRQLRDGNLWGHRHEVLSLAFLDWLACDEADRQWIAAALVSHHKDVGELRERYPSDLEEGDPVLDALVAEVPGEAVEALAVASTVWEQWRLEYGLHAVGAEPLPLRVDTAGTFRQSAAARLRSHLRGFYRLNRLLERSECSEAEVTAGLLLRGLVVTADHTASAHAQPPLPTLQGVDDLLLRLGRDWQELYEHQRVCGQTRGSAILTAPTGSGKTESALLWAARQRQDARGAPRIFYVLPFQASMNAMRQRLDRHFQGEVGLQHGRGLHALYRAYLQTEASPQRAAQQARWARNLSHLHAYPIKVLSPYQLLKAPYRLRGYEALLTDCFGGLFIFDEMHAYEPERLARIVGMMRFMQERLKARFCVMTATMPPPVVARVQQALGDTAEVRASDDLARRFCRHRLQLLDGEISGDVSLQLIADGALQGQAVLVCCNTVRRAQEVYADLKERLPQTPVQLLHSRFTARDRLAKEGALVGVSSQPIQPEGVLVATQVVEVSLNLDFDTIFTEPAPLEALLQRFGRVNRLRRVDSATVHVFKEPTDGQHVYDPLMVQRTLEVLSRADDQPVDESQVAVWLGEIYAGPLLEEWARRFEESAQEFEAACLHTLHPFASDDGLEEAFYRAFDNVEVLPACLESEYDALAEDDPIRATELLVGIAWRQYSRLRCEGCVRVSVERGRPAVVDAPYSSELGLTFASGRSG